MDPELLRRLFTYDDWANREVVAALRRMTDVPEKARKTLAHIVAAESLWLARLRGTEAGPVWPDFTIDDCAREIDRLRDEWDAFLGELTPERMADAVAYRNSKGEPWTSRAGEIVMHVVMHGAYHRGQIATATREEGGTPALTDYIHATRQGLV